jgi:hypothetical protein
MDPRKITDYLLQELREANESHKEFVLSGRPKEHAEYQHVCGVIRGLATAESIVKDLVQRLEQSNDD